MITRKELNEQAKAYIRDVLKLVYVKDSIDGRKNETATFKIRKIKLSLKFMLMTQMAHQTCTMMLNVL